MKRHDSIVIKKMITYSIPDLVRVQAFIGDEVFCFVENKDDYFPELVRINRDGQTVPMSLESGPKKAMFGSDIYASDKIATPYEIILGSQRPAISLKNAVESIQEKLRSAKNDTATTGCHFGRSEGFYSPTAECSRAFSLRRCGGAWPWRPACSAARSACHGSPRGGSRR